MPLNIWDAGQIGVKTVTYAATLGASGAVFFRGYAGEFVADSEDSRIRQMVLGLAALSIVAGAAQIPVSAGSMSGDASGMWDGSLLQMVWHAGAGRAAAIRTLGVLLAAVGISWNRASGLAYVGAATAATSFAWTGHARALNPDVLPMLLQSVHLLGVAFWLGALAPLLIVARGGALPRIAAAAARFGAAAVWVVVGMMAAGWTLLWRLLGDITALWTSPYGRYVILKLILVACLLCAAAFNKLRLTPQLLAGDPRGLLTLRTSLRLELLLGGLILAVTATFTTVTGPPALD